MYGQSVRLPLGRGLNGRGFDDDDDDDGKTYGEVRCVKYSVGIMYEA